MYTNMAFGGIEVSLLQGVLIREVIMYADMAFRAEVVVFIEVSLLQGFLIRGVPLYSIYYRVSGGVFMKQHHRQKY